MNYRNYLSKKKKKKNECAPSENSPPSLIRVFAARMKKPWVLSYPLSTQRGLWSERAHVFLFSVPLLVLSCRGSFVTGDHPSYMFVSDLKISLSIWTASWQNQQNGMYAQRRLRSGWVSAQSDQSLSCPLEQSLGPYLPFKRTAKTLIRLGGCPGWSESSLGAFRPDMTEKLLTGTLSLNTNKSLGAQSPHWFCHVAAHL